MWLISFALVLLAAGLRFLALPPFSISEAAFVCILPLVVLAYRLKQPRHALLWGWLAGFLFWTASIIWLRHVTVGGWLTVCGLLALFDGLWVWLLARHRSALRAGGLNGLAASVLLAALWAILEWVRNWFLFGFPWNPLALAFWNRPAPLQVTAWVGAGGLGFLIVMVNCGIAQTFFLIHRWKWPRELHRLPFIFPLAPALPLALAVLFLPAVLFVATRPQSQPGTLYRVSFVQPYIDEKWDDTSALENFATLVELTREAAHEQPDFILWPEAATPWPIVGNPYLQDAVEELVRELGIPILMGNLAWYPERDVFHNGIFIVTPKGLSPAYYAKRKLVPMGEFVPFRRFLPNVETIVPIGGDTTPGLKPMALELPLVSGRSLRVGPLVCYEDIFPRLARETVRLGVDFLFVATNNAWYGEEWGAEQHAVHSVLRAAENRVPVLRCGNAGWSGWIDERGVVRHRVANAVGSIFFRGQQTVEVILPNARDSSFYTRHGHWWPLFLTIIIAWAYTRQRMFSR